MDSKDRALDLVAVGLGQGGGNLAAEFAGAGYRALALNTAITDLSALADDDGLPSERRIYIGLDGFDGAGADLNYGRECIETNQEIIKSAVFDLTEGADALFIMAGLGGGTGSAVSELVKLVADVEIPIIVVATLPMESESGLAKVNAARALAELVKVPGIGIVFVDNTELARRNDTVSLDRYFSTVNGLVVAPIDAFNRMNHRDGVTPLRTIDGEDFRALLASGGVFNYAEAALQELAPDEIVQTLQQCLETSSLMPTGYSVGDLSTIGLVVEAPESVVAETPFAVFHQVAEQLKGLSGGAAIYLGVYRTTDDGGVRMRFLGSGTQIPGGITAMIDDARREGGVLRDKLKQSVAALDIGDIDDLDLMRTNSRSKPRSRARRPAAQRRGSLADNLAQTPPPPSGRESVMPPPPKLESIFEELVRRFENGSEAERTTIARKLEAARQSQHQVKRERAEQAVQRLDAVLYQTAVEAARHAAAGE